MATPRKKWRLKKIPSFTYETAPSATKAYARVEVLAYLYAQGMSPTHQVKVEVDERDGRGWTLFEIVTFPRRATK